MFRNSVLSFDHYFMFLRFSKIEAYIYLEHFHIHPRPWKLGPLNMYYIAGWKCHFSVVQGKMWRLLFLFWLGEKLEVFHGMETLRNLIFKILNYCNLIFRWLCFVSIDAYYMPFYGKGIEEVKWWSRNIMQIKK